MPKKLILIGGGGHCKSCIEVIESTNEFEICGILDYNIGDKVKGYEIIGNDDAIESLVEKKYWFLITIGQIKSDETRRKIFEILLKLKANIATVIAPTAYISKSASIGIGSIVMHQVFINAEVKIGQNCIINTRALIEHETEIADHCHISTNAILNGQVKIDDKCFIGSNAIIYQNVNIAANSKIGAQSVVHKTLKTSGTYLGNPIKKIK